MPRLDQERRAEVLDAAARAMETFCKDLAGMFDVEIEGVVHPPCDETAAGLRSRFDKLAAVNSVQAEGVLNGTFCVVFDQVGLFTLAGIVVMLPENRIEEAIGRASKDEAQQMGDAITEVGNFMTSTWDRVFRDAFGKRHGRFKQAGTFVGRPWDTAGTAAGLEGEDKFVFVPTEMRVAQYPEFTCGVVFPASVLAHCEAEPAQMCAEEAAVEPAVQEECTQAEDKDAEADQAAELQSGGGGSGSSGEPAGQEEAAAEDAAEAPGTEPGDGGRDMQIAGGPSGGRTAAADVFALTAGEVMQKGIAWLTGDDTVQDALDTMQEHETDHIMIGYAGVLEGVVSRSDVAGAVSPYLRPAFARWKRPLDDATLRIRLSWVMTPVQTITPETPLAAIMDTMLHSGGWCLPVVDSEGTMRGMVTVADILGAIISMQGVASSPAEAAAPV